MSGISAASVRAYVSIFVLSVAGAANAQLASVNYFTLPSGYQYPGSIAAGPDGALWFTLDDFIGRIDMLGNANRYAIPYSGSFPESIAAGADGNLWFTDEGTNSIGRVCAAVLLPACSTVGQITEYAVPSSIGGPSGITSGPDGALWFTEWSANNIGRITTAGRVTEYPITTPESAPNAITAGPDGALWFTETDAYNIGRITTTGSITEYPVTGFSNDAPITVGPDGALWFIGGSGSQVGQISTGTHPIVDYFTVDEGTGEPFAITTGADDALWLLDYSNYSWYLGRITTVGSWNSFVIDNGATGITSGPDGAIWFTFDSDTIGRGIPSSRRNGVDLSVFSAVPGPSALAQFQQAGVQYAVIEGSQQGSSVPLQQLNAFSNAGFDTAAYCFLYFYQGAGSGARQAQNCYNSISGALRTPSFVAVDVEVTSGQAPVCPAAGPWTACIQIIQDAIKTLLDDGAKKIVVYTNQDHWSRLTGDDATDFSSYPLWDAAHAGFVSYADAAGDLDCFTPRQQQARINSLLPTAHVGTGLPSLELPTAITAFSIKKNVVTLTASNTFMAGQQVSISGLTIGTFLNGRILTVLKTGLSSSQFEAEFTHPNVANTSDSGTATFLLFGGWQEQAGTQYDIGASGGTCLFGIRVDFDVFDPSLFQ
jgi:virginiamycin B lyase